MCYVTYNYVIGPPTFSLCFLRFCRHPTKQNAGIKSCRQSARYKQAVTGESCKSIGYGFSNVNRLETELFEWNFEFDLVCKKYSSELGWFQ